MVPVKELEVHGMTKNTHPNNTKSGCHTKCIVLSIRVTVKDWNYLLEKCGGEGKLSSHIRKQLGLKD
jgi:hypothetical protein